MPPPAMPERPDDVSERVRRRLDDVFGEVLPEVTRDEAQGGPDDRAAEADEWLRANRPPHHGGG